MKKISSLIISSALLLNGCTIGGGEDTATIPKIPTPTPTPTPEVTETPETPNNSSVSSVSGLITPINPQNRLRQIEQGRNDPFNSISPPAVITIRQDQPIPLNQDNLAIVRTPVPELSENSTEMAQNASTAEGNPGDGMIGGGKNGSPSGSMSDTIKIQKEEPIMPPSPTEALKMVVSGVMNVEGNNIALVQAPWSNITQSVKVGDIISDGNISVKVKEIRFNYPTSIALLENNQTVYRNIGNEQGFVVFEQYEQTVTKEIGETPQNTDEVAKL